MSSVTDRELVALVLATYDDLSNVALGREWGLSNGYVSQLRAGREPRLSALTRAAAINLLRRRGLDLDDPAWRERERMLAERLDEPRGEFSADYYRGARDLALRLLRVVRELEADASAHLPEGTGRALPGELGAPAIPGDGHATPKPKRHGR